MSGNQTDNYYRQAKKRVQCPPNPQPIVIPERCNADCKEKNKMLRNCRYCFTYLWLEDENNTAYWMYPVTVSNTYMSGYRWSDFGWVYVTITIDEIATYF